MPRAVERIIQRCLWNEPVLAGLIVGVIGALPVGRTFQSLLFGVKGADLLRIATVVALLLVVATGAVMLPTLRATRVNPIDALRYEQEAAPLSGHIFKSA